MRWTIDLDVDSSTKVVPHELIVRRPVGTCPRPGPVGAALQARVIASMSKQNLDYAWGGGIILHDSGEVLIVRLRQLNDPPTPDVQKER